MNALEKIEESLGKLKPAERNAAIKDALQNHYKSSLFATAVDLLGYDRVRPHSHGNVIRCLESPTKRKLIVEPRGTFKSTIGVVANSIWMLIRNPNERILIDSEIYSNSITYLREIKHHLESERLSRLFGTFRTKNWNESEITIAQRTVNKKEPSITAGGIGTTKVGQHYSVIISDDSNGSKNSATSEQRQKVIEHYQYNQAILDPDGAYTIIGTRWHVSDLIGWVIENELNIQNFQDNNSFGKLKLNEGVYYL